MITVDLLNEFATRDTATIADTLIRRSLLGTEVGDRVIAAVGNDPERSIALRSMLSARGYGEEI